MGSWFNFVDVIFSLGSSISLKLVTRFDEISFLSFQRGDYGVQPRTSQLRSKEELVPLQLSKLPSPGVEVRSYSLSMSMIWLRGF